MTPPPLDCLYRACVRTAQACRPAHQALQLTPPHHATPSKRPAWLSLTASQTQASHTHPCTHCSRCRAAWAALPAGARLALLSVAALGDAVDDLEHTNWSALRCCVRWAASSRRAPWASRRRSGRRGRRRAGACACRPARARPASRPAAPRRTCRRTPWTRPPAWTRP